MSFVKIGSIYRQGNWELIISKKSMLQRVISYIDGFNLYFGLREKGWRKYYWLDIQLLASNLLREDQELVSVKYFTARISAGDKDTHEHIRKRMEAKRRRQGAFLEALSTLDKVSIFEGHYLPKTITCNKCGNTWPDHDEKMTDVKIATELLMDTFSDNYDTALIISGDSDLVPPVETIRSRFPRKRIVIAFPPKRVSKRLKQVANAYFTIGEANIRKSMFPDKVRRDDGYVLKRPKGWS